MSQKIKSKDLSYDQNLPPFLQRLRAQETGRGDSDRHEREIARPRKARVANDEDEPTIVDESGELISKAELEERTTTEQDAVNAEQANAPSHAGQQSRKAAVDTSAGIKKRKIAKVVGEDSAVETSEELPPKSKVSKVSKKKSKPIKLAFDEEDPS